ncbi:hypothetical protein BC629DRAFT_1641530 [Irpex lacteus]|nr:hypothetical protein BC629DRAFT_1641530 [Irpex lacteus]
MPAKSSQRNTRRATYSRDRLRMSIPPLHDPRRDEDKIRAAWRRDVFGIPTRFDQWLEREVERGLASSSPPRTGNVRCALTVSFEKTVDGRTVTFTVCTSRFSPEKLNIDHSKLLTQRGPQTRGDVRTVSSSVTAEHFPFKRCTTQDDATREYNRGLYSLLVTNSAYLYTNYNNITVPDTVFRHPTIQMVINKAWFADQHSIGVIHQDFFVDDDGALHNEVIALVVTAIRHSLDQWKEGVHISSRKDKGFIEFSQKSYAGIYQTFVDTLYDWEKHTRYVSRDNSSTKYRQDLFRNALIHSGFSGPNTVSGDTLGLNHAEIFALNCGQSLRNDTA